MDAGIRWLRRSLGRDQLLGIDLEWRPTRSRGATSPLALMQVATASRVLLLHVVHMGPSAIGEPAGDWSSWVGR